VSKQEIDAYFRDNWREIERIIADNSAKCVTVNRESIASEIYLICIEKKARITNLSGFIRILASNIYRWNMSDFNKNNRIFASEIEIQDIYTDDETEEISHQNRLYALERYRLNASPSELRLLEIYKEGITTVRGLQSYLGISFHGSVVMLREFKQKIINYEREIEKSKQD
jgi:hypothetical protein